LHRHASKALRRAPGHPPLIATLKWSPSTAATGARRDDNGSCGGSVPSVEAPAPLGGQRSAGRGRVRRGATRKPHAGDTGNPIADRVLGANDQHACLTSCRRVHNGFPRGDVPPVSAVTNFVAIAVHADEQCENRCGFVATHFVAVIRARREIKTVSAEYRDYQKRFHFRTNSQRIIFVGFLSRVWRSILGVRNAGGTDAVLRQELSRPQAS